MVASRFALDPPRNMTTAPNPSSLTTALTCKYDAWNRLVEADPTGVLTFKHEYDGLNRRTARKVEAGEIEAYQYFYYNASWQRLEMRPDVTTGDPPEQLQPYCQHVWSARYIDAPVLWDRDADNDSQTGDLGKSGSGLEERLYYLGDANFNVTTLVDTSGDAVEHYQYDPYGRVKVLNGAAPDTDGDEWTDDPYNNTDVANVILYTGREYDSIICLYQYRHRYYHAELGRFLSRDPMGYSARDVNLYRYVENDPVGKLDYEGLTKIGWILEEFFSVINFRPNLWVMGEDDSYTGIVRGWTPVQHHIARVKQAVAADPADWASNHMTSRSWTPTMSGSPDPKKGWNRWEKDPPGTDPVTCAANYELYKRTGIQTEALHTGAIGSFRISATADEVDVSGRTTCRVKLNIWMYNPMSRDSFGRFAYLPQYVWRPMATQHMWWNWKEEFIFDAQGNITDIPSGGGGGATGAW